MNYPHYWDSAWDSEDEERWKRQASRFHIHKWPNIMYFTLILPMLCTLYPTVVIFPCISFLVYPARAFQFFHAIYSMFPCQNSVCISFLPQTYYIPNLSHPPWVNLNVNIQWRVQIVKLLFIQISEDCCSSFLLGQNISLFTWFSNSCTNGYVYP